MHPYSDVDRPSGPPAASSGTAIVGAIPARYGSQRLPGKALHPLAGKPMVEHVYRRAARASGLDRVVVLTDDERIARAVEFFGGDVEMTPAECASGTDRICGDPGDSVLWRGNRCPISAVRPAPERSGGVKVKDEGEAHLEIVKLLDLAKVV